jgi:hypothetical protein
MTLLLIVAIMCMVTITMGFSPVARRAMPSTVRILKPTSSETFNSFNFRLFADNDGKKITRDKEGEFFESDVSMY